MLRFHKIAPCAMFVFTLFAGVGELSAQPTGPVEVKQHTETVTVGAAPTDNQVLVQITGGAALSSGNTRSYTVTLGGQFGLFRKNHQLSVNALGMITAAKPPRGEKNPDGSDDYVKTAANIIGKARYDLFLSNMDALFLALVPRRDVFAGLDLRMQMQAGYSRFLYAPSPAHRFWAEAGYDLTYDNFATLTATADTTLTVSEQQRMAAGLPASGDIIQRTTTSSNPGHEFIHSARAFLGYTNALSKLALLNLGVEALFDVKDGKNVRINTVADLTTTLSDRFKLGFVSRMFFDNVPVPAAPALKKADFVSTLQVIYSFDSLAGSKQEVPACDCSDDVKKATEEAQKACTQAGPSSAPAEDNALPEPSAPVEDKALPESGAPVETAPAAGSTEAPPAAETTPADATPAAPAVEVPPEPQVPVQPPAPAPANPPRP